MWMADITQSGPNSRVLLNTGDGKGKSSAAFGVMARAWARGWKTGVVQFIKGPDWKTGEHKLGAHLGVTWHTLGDGFTWESDDLDESKAQNVHAWHVASAMLASGDWNLLILDEITYLPNFGWVGANEIASAVKNRAPETNVILTGRDADALLVEVADTVTEMRCVRHAFDSGIIAKKGIEY